MIDKQTPARVGSAGIPVISPVIHCLAMPVIVLLRWRFGYSYLSPKTIFFALIFATILLDYALWHDLGLRPNLLSSALFLTAAFSAYLINLAGALICQGVGRAEHDQFSGRSYLLVLMGKPNRPKYETLVHTSIEPLIAGIAGLVLLPDYLGRILLASAAALALKELIGVWLAIRLKKRTRDNLQDAKDSMSEARPNISQEAPAAGKSSRERYPRRFTVGSDGASAPSED